jgi:hypothetical protein
MGEMEEISLFEKITELSTEEQRERFDVDQEIFSCGEPLAIGRESASGCNVVNVGMVEEVTGPGMKHTDHPEMTSDSENQRPIRARHLQKRETRYCR